MYSTCLYCHTTLGANERLRAFPVGRRVAFDPARGRLWVICPRCRRWNLSPLEERWEAIEELEQLCHDTGAHASTANVALTVLPDGMDIVRVGTAARTELAWWRWARALKARGRFGWIREPHQLVLTGAVQTVMGGAVPLLAVGLGAPLIGGTGMLGIGVRAAATFGLSMAAYRAFWNRRVVGLRLGMAGVVRLRRLDVHAVGLRLDPADGASVLDVPHDGALTTLRGPDARTAAAILLARLNLRTPSTVQLHAGLARLAAVSDSMQLFTRTARDSNASARFSATGGDRLRDQLWQRRTTPGAVALARLSPVERLALEMAAAEESEQQLLNGEIAELERAWRDAEEIAGIADGLPVSKAIEDQLNALRRPSP